MKKVILFNEILTFKRGHDREELGMIISNNMDIVYDGLGAVSIKKWDALIDDILRWHFEKNKKDGE